jgi:hypothetical protein
MVIGGYVDRYHLRVSRRCSCCGSVFVDESAEEVVALDRGRGRLVALVVARVRRASARCGRSAL